MILLRKFNLMNLLLCISLKMMTMIKWLYLLNG